MIYTDGTIAIKAGSPIVTGTGTQWKKNIYGVAPGQLISIENGTAPVSMMIRAVNSDTELVLSFNAPVTLSGAKYSIATTVPDTISDAARTMSANQGYIVYFLRAMQQWMTDTGQVEIELPNGQKVTLEDVKGLASQEWVKTVLFGVGDKTAKASGIMNPDNTMWWGAHNDNLYAKQDGKNYNVLQIDKNDAVTVMGKLDLKSLGHYTSFKMWRLDNTGVLLQTSPYKEGIDGSSSITLVEQDSAGKNVNSWTFAREGNGGTVASRQWVNKFASVNSDSSNRFTSPGMGAGFIARDDGRLGLYNYIVGGYSVEFSITRDAQFYGSVKSISQTGTNTNFEASSPDNKRKVGLWAYNSPEGESNGQCLIAAYSNGSWSNIQLQDVGSGKMAVIGGNTAFDGSGYLKRSSPIIQIFPDGNYDTNDESAGAEVRRTGTGQYHIIGILGYNSDGAWGVNGGISVPKDNNGLELVYVDDRVQEDGSIIIETCHRQHAHLPERFVSTPVSVPHTF
ncbi:hypothetical protein ABM057_19975 [Morganella morganii]|uniref:phage tail fiber protein n=1 Tax=Morganella morganii TaxID=582 RepID=UPI003EB9D685